MLLEATWLHIPLIDAKDVVITTQKDEIVLFKGKISNGILKGNVSTKLARYEDHQNNKYLHKNLQTFL